jgi:hypothetical protein
MQLNKLEELTVSNHKSKTIEVPPFDALSGQVNPFLGFGQILPNSFELEKRFQETLTKALRNVKDGFKVKLAIPNEIPRELDRIIVGMWDSGWNPESGNVNLFSRDFGCILTKAVLDSLGGISTFRSIDDISHFSIFWPDAKLEAFPFHKVLKCLYNRNGETMISFIEGLAGQLGKPLATT